MWFKSKAKPAAPPHSGTQGALSGRAAAESVEAAACGADAVRDCRLSSGAIGNLTGRTLAGQRAAAFMEGGALSAALGSLNAAAGGRLAAVLHLTCGAATRQAGSLGGGQDQLHAVDGAGCFDLFAKNVQEAADFPLIARRIAELTLTPGLCALDAETARSTASVRVPGAGLIKEYLGLADDLIESPTPAQEMLFGKKRRRIPVLFDPDRPMGLGSIQDQDSFFKALAAQRVFFFDHVAAAAKQAMREFGELTGRHYAPVSGYRLEDAEYVVIARGDAVEALEEAADFMRKNARVKAGVLNLSMFRPFAGAELSLLLRGKKAATVLERTDPPLSEDAPLMKEVRCALDKAFENGASAKGGLAYPGYAAFKSSKDRPSLYCGVYGVGRGRPPFQELVSVFKNMSRGSGKKRFYLGVKFNDPGTRFPQLEAAQQSLKRNYPALENITLEASPDSTPAAGAYGAFQLHTIGGLSGPAAGGLLTESLTGALGWNIRTFEEAAPPETILPTVLTLVHSKTESPAKAFSGRAQAVMVTHEKLLEDLSALEVLEKGGALTVQTELEPPELWASLDPKTKSWIIRREARLFTVPALRIALEAASFPYFADHLSVFALIGGFLKAGLKLASGEIKLFKAELKVRLEDRWKAEHFMVDDIMKTLERGLELVEEFDCRSAPQETAARVEKDSPWTLRDVKQSDGTLFDPARLWNSVGYLYETGRRDKTLADPFVATGSLPARTSAFHDLTPFRFRFPRLLAENCTGCGLCWSICPDSALPTSVQSVDALIEAAVKAVSDEGQAMTQMARAGGNLAKMAYKLAAQDELHRYLKLGPLLKDAFTQLLDKMGLEPEKRTAIEAEFAAIYDKVEHFPIVRTDAFFVNAHKNKKGSGRLLSIALNPSSCKGCLQCVEICEDNALESVVQTPELAAQLRKSWDFSLKVPDSDQEFLTDCLGEAAPEAPRYKLLSKKAYYSLVGGDGSFPGSGVKTAVHLAAASIESVMRPRVDAYVKKLDDIITRLREKVQSGLNETLQVNDFEKFGDRLSRIEGQRLDIRALAGVMKEDDGGKTLDREVLARRSRFVTELESLKALTLEGAGGDGRARLGMAVNAGGSLYWMGSYPYNPCAFPWAGQRPGDAATVAAGLFEGTARRMAESFAVVRAAELDLNDSYDPGRQAKVPLWDELTPEEFGLIPPILVLDPGGPEFTANLAGVLTGGLPIKVFIIDSQGLPEDARGAAAGAGLHGLSFSNVFVHQSTIGSPDHLMAGIAKGVAEKRPALFHIYAPDPQRQGIAPKQVPAQAKAAYESRLFPLFTFDPEAAGPWHAKLSLEGNPGRESDWADHRGAKITGADWAFQEARFLHHFEWAPKAEWTGRMKPLTDYLDLPDAEREGCDPFIEVLDKEKRVLRLKVSPAMAAAAGGNLRSWRMLRELAGGRRPVEPPAPAPVFAPPPAPLAGGSDRELSERLSRNLHALAGFGRDPGELNVTLRDFIGRLKKPGGAK